MTTQGRYKSLYCLGENEHVAVVKATEGRVRAASEAELWTALTPSHLLALHHHFSPPPREWTSGDEGTTRLLSRVQFVDAVISLLGSERYEGVSGAIFDAAVASSPCPASSTSLTPAGSGSSNISSTSTTSSLGGGGGGGGPCLGWGGLVCYLAAGVAGREGVAGVVVCKRRLVVVGARGALTKMNPTRWRDQQHARLHLDSTPDEDHNHIPFATRKVGVGSWVVGVAGVEEGVAAVVASSSTLHFLETSTSPQELLRVTSLPALPSCIAAGCHEGSRWVALGDDSGAVHLLRFPHPAAGLLTRPRSEGLTILTWQEVCERRQEVDGRCVDVCVDVDVVSEGGMHSAGVRGVDYNPATSTLVSCSGDPRASLVLWGPNHRTKTYTFAVPRGVRVFAVEWSLHVLVTGSSDGRVRVWNPYVPDAPLALLPPAPAPPAAITIYSPRQVIITLDTDNVVRVYGLEGVCVQTIPLTFPGGVGGLAPQPFTLMPNGDLLVACRDYLASLLLAPPPPHSPHHHHQHQHQHPTPGDDWWLADGESVNSGLDEDGPTAAGSEGGRLIEEAGVTSSEAKREREHMRDLIRQGAAFCCLSLAPVSPPKLPPNLPLPPRLAALGLTSDDPDTLLARLPSTAAQLPSRRLTPAPPKSPRPPSQVSAVTTPGPTTPAAATATGHHLTPAWPPPP
ncbi:hypothetical protein Pcinc_006710 [Petrolisthes cinctipes]|uniref:Uncharacterized protein n=1 Tax=Petrolisthes cinctipes TaxID=88211 RepID=A0AAE1GA27_PETCI|nr:hypothetical protein Pcinc_006710 [Petrolisthes cinctipes]